MRAWAGIVLAMLAGGVCADRVNGIEVMAPTSDGQREGLGTVPFPALGSGLWRRVVEDTPYVETVGVDPPKRPRA